MLGGGVWVAAGAGVADWVVAGAGAERSFGAGAGVGNGMVSARIAATPASHPDSNTAIHPAWRMPAMSLSACARFPLRSRTLRFRFAVPVRMVRYPVRMAIRRP